MELLITFSRHELRCKNLSTVFLYFAVRASLFLENVIEGVVFLAFVHIWGLETKLLEISTKKYLTTTSNVRLTVGGFLSRERIDGLDGNGLLKHAHFRF